MKKLVTGLLASVLLASSLPALADPHGPGGHYYGPPPPRHHHHYRGPGPVVWGLAGLALGTALYTIAAPPPVIAAPAVVMPAPRPPGRMAYFCESYQAWYPNVQYCPEGWRAVPAY